ncbi:hypothetical protein P0D75_02380 [Paraburkholderia sediminicola]|uniref:hypothetical protein n=1 Tax=Paraburkholderia sediminicola TaxID=458836 RepID=UPI0038BD005A
MIANDGLHPAAPHVVNTVGSVTLNAGKVIVDDYQTKSLPQTTETLPTWAIPNCTGDVEHRVKKIGASIDNGGIIYEFDQDLTRVTNYSVKVGFNGPGVPDNSDLVTNNSVEMGKGTVGPFVHPSQYVEEDNTPDIPSWNVQYITLTILKNHTQTPVSASALIDAYLNVTFDLGPLGHKTNNFWLHEIPVQPIYQTIQSKGSLFSETVATKTFAHVNVPVKPGDPACATPGVKQVSPVNPWGPDASDGKKYNAPSANGPGR